MVYLRRKGIVVKEYWPFRVRFLPPANKVCEGYVFTPVGHSVHRGGGSAPVHAGMHTPPLGPEADPPRPPPPPPGAVHGGRYGQQPGDLHPTGMHTCLVYFFT